VATAIVSSAVPSVEPAAKPHASVYEIITSRIVEELEKGQVPWRKPWRTLPPANLVSKKPYRGINVFLLALQGYGSQYWLTFNQAKQLGGNVRRGEHGTKIVFWKFDRYETETADGETEEHKSAFLRYYTVFNLEQTEGLKALLALPPAFPIESAEEILKGMQKPSRIRARLSSSVYPLARRGNDALAHGIRVSGRVLLDTVPRADPFDRPREETCAGRVRQSATVRK